jgi:hypothetical protein
MSSKWNQTTKKVRAAALLVATQSHAVATSAG